MVLGFLALTMGGALAAEPSSLLTGGWEATETAHEKQQRLQAIDEATADLRVPWRSKVRSRLVERTAPPEELTIEIEGSKVVIASGGHGLRLELGDSPIEVSGRRGKVQVGAEMVGERLIVVARNSNGERTTAYRASGDRLIVEVKMSGSKLTAPLAYVATYARKSH
jgi:hypothetical protein